MQNENGKQGMRVNNVCAALYLGVTDEGDANRDFSPHATRQCFGACMTLVFKVQDTDDAVHFIWNPVFQETFQLEMRQKAALNTTVSPKLPTSVSH